VILENTAGRAISFSRASWRELAPSPPSTSSTPHRTAGMEAAMSGLAVSDDGRSSDAREFASLLFAAERGDVVGVRACLAAADATEEDLADALEVGGMHLDVVVLLLAAGANVHHANETGSTALHLAAVRGKVKVLDALLSAGADVNTPDLKSFTPLYFASQSGRFKVHPAPCNRACVPAPRPGRLCPGVETDVLAVSPAPLHSSLPQAVERLLEAGADPNAATLDKITPLIIACQQGHTAIVGALVRAGATLDARVSSKALALIWYRALTWYSSLRLSSPRTHCEPWKAVGTRGRGSLTAR